MGTTARLAIPYPAGTDRVMDGDNAMQTIAETLDDLSKTGVPYRMATGIATVAISSATQGQQAVTFPVGRFTVTPIIIAWTWSWPSATLASARTSGSASANGFTVVVNTSTAVTGSYTVHWLAIQMTSSSGAG